MRRAILAAVLCAAAAGLVAAFAVAVLSATLFSPRALVEEYLGHLDRGEASSALALPGAAPGSDLDRTLLVDGAIEALELESVEELSRDDDRAIVRVSWGGADPGVADIEIVRQGSRALLFPRWVFAEPPLGTVTATVRGDDRVTLAGSTVELEGGTGSWPAPAFARVRVELATPWLEADPQLVAVSPGATSTTLLEATPREEFTAAVAELVTERLEACEASGVLAPAGCPFAAEIDERVLTAPTWTVTEAPVVSLAPSGEARRWVILDAPGEVVLRTRIERIADGSREQVRRRLDFALSGSVVIRDDGLLEVTVDEGWTR